MTAARIETVRIAAADAIAAQDLETARWKVAELQILIESSPDIDDEGRSIRWRNSLEKMQQALNRLAGQQGGIVRNKVTYSRVTDV